MKKKERSVSLSVPPNSFTYMLETDRPEAKEGGRKCEDIRYEMRPVANAGDGTMSMIQVPVCL